jgi:hypothetical protein
VWRSRPRGLGGSSCTSSPSGNNDRTIVTVQIALDLELDVQGQAQRLRDALLGLLSSTERSCNTEGVGRRAGDARGFVRMLFVKRGDLRHVDQGWGGRCATPTSDF